MRYIGPLSGLALSLAVLSLPPWTTDTATGSCVRSPGPAVEPAPDAIAPGVATAAPYVEFHPNRLPMRPRTRPWSGRRTLP